MTVLVSVRNKFNKYEINKMEENKNVHTDNNFRIFTSGRTTNMKNV